MHQAVLTNTVFGPREGSNKPRWETPTVGLPWRPLTMHQAVLTNTVFGHRETKQ
jgi:hypothetical protein